MKRKYIIIGLICFWSMIFATQTVEAQIIKGEAFVGLNLSQVDGDEAFGFKRYGIHGGLGALIPVYKKDKVSFDVSLEVLFSQKGSHQRAQYVDNGDGKTGAYDLFMNYVEVPVLFYVNDKQIVSLGVGASYGRLVELREYEHGKETNVTIQSGDYKTDDYSIIADVKLRVYDRFKVAVRYQYSMAKIRTRNFTYIDDSYTWTRNQFNNVVTVRAIWVFNENKDELIREEYRFDGNPKFHQKTLDRKIRKLEKKEAREKRRKK